MQKIILIKKAECHVKLEYLFDEIDNVLRIFYLFLDKLEDSVMQKRFTDERPESGPK